MKSAFCFITVAFLYGCFAEAKPRFLRSTWSRIIGGDDVTKFPQWQASLFCEHTYSHHCGAVILSNTKVLTAAHCIAECSLAVGVGLIEKSKYAQSPSQVYGISDVSVHPYYNNGDGAFANDVAVLTVYRPIEFIAGQVGGIEINPYVVDSIADARLPGKITGWGRTDSSNSLPDTLQETIVDVLTDDVCRGYPNFNTNINPSAHTCVISQDRNSGACNGDSGGPLTFTYEGTDYLVGVASWVMTNNGACSTNYPSVYAEVSTYRNWIEQQ